MHSTNVRCAVVEPLERRTLLSVQLVADIDTDTLGSNPRDFVTLGDRALFFASQPDGKYTLWGTDGTTAGTAAVRTDLVAVPGDGFRPTAAGGRVYFQTAAASTAQYQLWLTDGTPAGTQPVKVITAPYQYVMRQFVPFAGRVFFQAADAASGTELWSTDGTSDGTSLFMDLVPGPASSYVSALTVSGQYLYFRTDQSGASTLWRTDGTVQNTIQLGQFDSNFRSATIDFGGKLIFTSAPPGEFADQLWESDGSVQGTRMITDVSPFNTSVPTELVAMNGAIYFVAPADQGDHRTLWRSDLTAAGTSPVLPNPPAGFNPSGLQVVDNQVFFQASDPVAGREAWRTDGTPAGTYRLRDINPGTTGSVSSSTSPFAFPAAVKGGVYFFANDGVAGTEAWFSDGSTDPSGTFLLKDIYPGYFQGVFTSAPAVLPNGKLVFGALDPSVGPEPYVSDATTTGTKLLLDIETRNTGSAPTEVIDAGGTPLVAALPPFALQDHNQNDFQRALFRVDPTSQNATFVSPGEPQNYADSYDGRGVYPYVTFKGRTYYFTSFQGDIALDRLFRTDGTAAGTEPFGSYYADAGEVAVTQKWLYFDAVLNGSNSLYRTDGTLEGTQRVGDSGQNPRLSVANGNTLYFAVGGDLWKISDEDQSAFHIGYTGGRIAQIVPLGQKLLVVRGSNLGSTDDAGTDITKTFINIIMSGPLIPLNGKVLFPANGAHYLYVSDGTEQGTRPLVVNGKSVPAFNLRVVGDYLYFVSNDGVHGSEWWRTDGTDAGTALWQDMEPGPGGSDPTLDITINTNLARSIVSWRGSIYFTAQTSAFGAELWRADAEGGSPPVLVADLYPGSTGSDPTALTVISDNLYFIAQRPDIGREVFRVVDDVAPRLIDAAFDPSGLGQIRLHVSESVRFPSGAPSPNLINRATLAPAAATLAASFDAASGLLTLTPTASLADGDYRLTVPAAWITDASGNPLTADFTFDFFVLAGDVNRDRSVDFSDLVILAQNYNGVGGRTFAQGDINGDGNVDFSDLTILAQRYGTVRPPPPVAAIAPAPAPVAAASSIVRDRTAAKPIFSVTPVAKPAVKPKAMVRPQHR